MAKKKYDYKQSGQVMGKGAVKESRQTNKAFAKKYTLASKAGLRGAVRLSAAMSTGRSAG